MSARQILRATGDARTEPIIATRHAVAALVHRHPDLVRRRCRPVACDAVSKLPLYDIDEVDEAFAATRRRVAS